MAHSSSSNNHRSVINDLAVEAQKVREKMKRYKQPGPAVLHKNKLFEIKVHGLSKEKKKECKTTLRDFTASLNNLGASSLQGKKKPSRHNGDHIYSGSEIQLNHASSSSSSLRPADSAYASMSTSAKCASTSLGRPTRRSTRSLKQKVEDYLQDIPEGLYSQRVIMADKKWKNVVIQRLEQLFTGKISGRYAPKKQPLRSGNSLTSALAVADAKTMGSSTVHERPPPGDEPTQGAKIVPLEQHRQLGNKNLSERHGSTFHPNEDQMEIGCNDNNTVFGTNLSPPMPLVSEQRPSDIMRPVAKPTESQGQEYGRRKHQYEGDITRDRKNDLCGDAGKAKCCDGVGDKVEGIFGEEAGGYGEDYGRGDLDDGYDGAGEAQWFQALLADISSIPTVIIFSPAVIAARTAEPFCAATPEMKIGASILEVKSIRLITPCRWCSGGSEHSEAMLGIQSLSMTNWLPTAHTLSMILHEMMIATRKVFENRLHIHPGRYAGPGLFSR
ncbi:hypothetical protein FAUST_7161 [Fusarium austroamericanum]|uniref:Uncharacterized protein n=1 Tax=Fusarium austroamericanum TaxID=282268 RepID=A0AAN6BYR7_FUSAU|nr:hypothetical protein FAUST_7161 [Fusarium austroamericanum]